MLKKNDFLYLHVDTCHRPNLFFDVAGLILGTSPARHCLFHFVSYRVATTAASLQFWFDLGCLLLLWFWIRKFWIKEPHTLKRWELELLQSLRRFSLQRFLVEPSFTTASMSFASTPIPVQVSFSLSYVSNAWEINFTF